MTKTEDINIRAGEAKGILVGIVSELESDEPDIADTVRRLTVDLDDIFPLSE